MQLSMFDTLDVPSTPTKVRPKHLHQSIFNKRIKDTPSPATPSVKDYMHIITDDDLGHGGAKTKYTANLRALRILKAVAERECSPTAEECTALGGYVGWGAIPQVFDLKNTKWAEDRKQLQELLTPEQWAAARASTPNAHYTSPPIINEIWRAIRRLGFRSGKVLEPACGVGNFFGCMPENMRRDSALVGVELEPIAAQIASHLYQKATIKNCGFESLREKDSYDLVISNVPFGNYPVIDREFYSGDMAKYSGASIHEYFFLKALSAARPGGLVAFITSRFLMDKRDPSIREAIASRAKLLAAIRLPVDTFKRNAGTEVTTDVIFLQKYTQDDIDKTWVMSELERGVSASDTDKPTYYNEYYHRNRNMIIGRHERTGGRFADAMEVVYPHGNDKFRNRLSEAINQVPKDSYSAKPAPTTAPEMSTTTPTDEMPTAQLWHRAGSFDLTSRNQVMVYDGQNWKDAGLTGVASKRVASLCRLRNAFREVLDINLAGGSDDALRLTQGVLNKEYDSHVVNHGPIHGRKSRLAFRSDPDYPALCAIEDWDSKRKRASKTPFFSQRTIAAQEKATSADSPQDAIAISLRERGEIDIDYVADLLGLSPDTAGVAIVDANLAYRDPVDEQWWTAEEFLSGNIREKLIYHYQIKGAPQHSIPHRERNTEALESALPEWIAAEDIFVQLGAHWIDAKYVNEFINNVIFGSVSYGRIKAIYTKEVGKWSLDKEQSGRIGWSSENMSEWGIPERPALDCIEASLNSKIVSVTDTIQLPDGREKRVRDKTKTIAAQEKQSRIEKKFVEWLWNDPTRREELERVYNHTFNSIVERTFDGSHLTFPGKSADIVLKDHQVNFVWRACQDPTALAAHAVGYGKTFAMIAAAMEMKRLGVANKIMFAIKNSTFDKFLSEIYRLYPGANVLAVPSMAKAVRTEMMAKIATQDWDIIVTTHETFQKVPMLNETLVDFTNRQINMLMVAKERDGEKSPSIKEMEKAIRRLKKRLSDLENKGHERDDCLAFEESGIDAVFVDEAQVYKNLWFATSMSRVAGVQSSASGRAWDAYMKLSWLQEQKSGSVIFATGTPIENSISEMYNLMRFLDHKTLKALGIEHFDAWAKVFGQVVNNIEMKPDGSGFQEKSRFARFNNVPELLRLYWKFADVQNDPEKVGLDLPKLYEGKPIGVSAAATDELREITQILANRADNMPDDPRIDNMLKIAGGSGDANKASLDPRLLGHEMQGVDGNRVRNPAFPPGADFDEADNPGSKVNLCVENLLQVYQRHPDSTQAVFLDLSTPGKGWSVYQDIKDKLIAQGIPANEIAFAHDAKTKPQTLALQKAVNRAEIKIILGSTQKLGIGVNIQEKLIALHHLDCPWKPAELEQREGRIIRQGNENRNIYIFRYVTEESFDVYRWQTVESKAKFISQVMNGNIKGVRSVEDVDAIEIGYAEMKALATGNTAVLDLVKAESDLQRAYALKASSGQGMYDRRRRLNSKKSILSKELEKLARIEEIISILEDDPELTQADSLGQRLYDLCEPEFGNGEYTWIATLYGMDVKFKSTERPQVAEGKVAGGNLKDFWTQQDDEEPEPQEEVEQKKIYNNMVAITINKKTGWTVKMQLRDNPDLHGEQNSRALKKLVDPASFIREARVHKAEIAGLHEEIKNTRALIEATSAAEDYDKKIRDLQAKIEELRKEIAGEKEDQQ